MNDIDRFLAQPSNHWSYGERPGHWPELVALLDALPPDPVGPAVERVARSLAAAYEAGGSTGVYFEDDQRVAPAHWYLPEPKPQLLVAREVDLDLEVVAEDALLALAASPWSQPITRVILRNGILDEHLPALLASPLFQGVDVLHLPGCFSLGRDGVARILAAPGLQGMSVLDVSFCGIDERAVEDILAAPGLPNLSMLTVDANCIDQYGERGQEYQDDLYARLEARGIALDVV